MSPPLILEETMRPKTKLEIDTRENGASPTENLGGGATSVNAVGAVATLVLATTLPTSALSQTPPPQPRGEIRVDTQIYLKGAAQPYLSNRTLFADSSKGWRTYDFVLGEKPETTVLDMGDAPHFAMISPQRRVMCIVPLLRVDEFTTQQRARAKFAPKFAISQAADVLTLKSDELTYRVKLHDPQIPGCHGKYQEFATWYAKLNAMRPFNPPSAGRETLNEEVAKRRMVPKEVWRSMVVRGKPQVEVRSTHEYIGSWSDEDRQKVAEADRQLKTFTEVSVEEFFNPRAAISATKKTVR